MDPVDKVNYSFWGKPAVMETAADMMFCMVPIWVAIAIGLLVGWSWKPQWVSILLMGVKSRPRLIWETPPGYGARRFWLAMMAVSALPMWKDAWKTFSAWMWPPAEVIVMSTDVSCAAASSSDLVVKEEVKKQAVTAEDLERFLRLLNGTDGGPAWNLMMDKSISDLTYTAWRRDPEEGPTQYKSRTVFENLSPEFIRDFFWDDQSRPSWDDMLSYSKVWEEDRDTGSLIVQWVRKYPFFCKDREYILAKRIFEHNGAYYCICVGTDYPEIPRQVTPRRVDVFFSSWRIRAVESSKGNGQKTACEVMLFHFEEMGIQKDLAKLGIRQGMWGCVKKMEPGIAKYKALRKAGEPPSRSALAARKSTKVPRRLLDEFHLSSKSSDLSESAKVVVVQDRDIDHDNKGYLKWVILGGAVALACGIDRGAVGKFLVFGVAKRLGRVGRRL